MDGQLILSVLLIRLQNLIFFFFCKLKNEDINCERRDKCFFHELQI